MSWYAHCGPRRSETGKFHSQAQLGTGTCSGGRYRDWFYSFVTHQTGSGVRRKLYAVSICDPNKNRVEYLRDFSSVKQATEAAQHWIDKQLGPGPTHSLREPKSQSRPYSIPGPISIPGSISKHGSVGTIPSLPTPAVTQEN